MSKAEYLKDIRFLVVDDNAFMRATVRRILETLGAYHAVEATDGAQAVEIVNTTPIDVVLTDWEMAPLDGVELTRILRSSPDPTLQYMPIIIISAHSEHWRIAQARDMGVSEYVVKPISATRIFSKVRSVIERPRAFIKAPGYFGPDRRRSNKGYFEERRKAVPVPIFPNPAQTSRQISLPGFNLADLPDGNPHRIEECR